MLLGFKRRFAPYIEDGTKTHTIRGKRKIPPTVGEMCHCYVDPRQKTMRLLGRWLCTKIDDIRIKVTFVGETVSDVDISLNGSPLDHDEINELCWRDGFRPVRHCDAWISFAHQWKAMHGLKEFSGDLIHWRFSR